MADKKENEIEKATESKTEIENEKKEKKRKQEIEKIENVTKQEDEIVPEINQEKAPELRTGQENTSENSTGKEETEEQLTSLDILWRSAFSELDEWAKHADYRDDLFLKEATYYADRIQQSQGNIKELTEKFNKEFAEWERTAREEFLMSTTTLQHFFPQRSYEEINEQIDKIQKRTMSILSTPCQAIIKNRVMDKYLETIEQYISLRKKGRMQYIKTIKQAANLIFESQKGFVTLFSKQIKTLMFPLNKYMEKAEEITKS